MPRIRIRTVVSPELGSGRSSALRVVLPKDTVQARDRAPLKIAYYIINGANPIQFDNNPGFYEVRVETDKGSLVQPNRLAAPAGGSWGETRQVLPAGAVLGQVLNLRCIQDGAGYGGDPLTASEDCIAVYGLEQPGSYRVVMRYEGPTIEWDSAEVDGAAADTGGGVRNARLVLSDTASLIVVP